MTKLIGKCSEKRWRMGLRGKRNCRWEPKHVCVLMDILFPLCLMS